MALNRKASLLYIIAFALYLGLSLMLGVFLPEDADYGLMLALNAVVVSIPAFLIPALLFRRKNGFARFSAPKAVQVLIAVALGVGCILLNLALVSLNSALFFDLEINSTALDVRESLSESSLLIMLFSVVLIPAISEEFLMRGALYESWRRYSPLWGAVFSALLFALLHLAPSNLIVYFAMGMLFALVYYITRNVWLTVVIHLMNNLLSVLSAMMYLNGGEELEELAQSAEYTRADYFTSFFSMALLAGAIIVPMIILLRNYCRNHKLGMFAAEPERETADNVYETVEPLAELEESTESGSLFSDPLLWISIAVLVLFNVLFGLIEFGVIDMGV